MTELISWLVIVLTLICGYSVGYGVNLKKWYGWTQILASFMLGFFLFYDDESLVGKIAVGVIFAMVMLLLGPLAWKRRHS